MIKVDYPLYHPKIKGQAGREIIFDEVRRQWISLTPEEWVRQNFLQYLVQTKQYPASLIAVEKEIKLGELNKRFDIVIYDKNMQPWMIVECKEMNEQLNEKVLSQALRYNITLQVPYIIITNGNYCYGFTSLNGQFAEIDELPDYQR